MQKIIQKQAGYRLALTPNEIPDQSVPEVPNGGDKLPPKRHDEIPPPLKEPPSPTPPVPDVPPSEEPPMSDKPDKPKKYISCVVAL